jgi:FkbM family methyltransferase
MSKFKNIIKFIAIELSAIPVFSILLVKILQLFKYTKKPPYPCLEFYKYIKNGTFKEKYDSFIKDLDDKSIYDINFILNCIENLINKKRYLMSNYDNELFMFLRKNSKLQRNIKKISNGIYAYKNYILPINLFNSDVFDYYKGIYNIKDISYIKDKNIFDVGGCYGDTALIFSNFTNQNVYVFEPIINNYNYLKETIELNNLTGKIIPEKLALGSVIGQEEIVGNLSHLGASHLGAIQDSMLNDLDDNSNFSEIINIDTLDNYCIKNNINNIGLISVDIEGAEQLFLSGAVNTIKKFKPILLISIYHNPEDFFEIKPMIESWNLGYNFKVRRFPGHFLAETILICER